MAILQGFVLWQQINQKHSKERLMIGLIVQGSTRPCCDWMVATIIATTAALVRSQISSNYLLKVEWPKLNGCSCGVAKRLTTEISDFVKKFDSINDSILMPFVSFHDSVIKSLFQNSSCIMISNLRLKLIEYLATFLPQLLSDLISASQLINFKAGL